MNYAQFWHLAIQIDFPFIFLIFLILWPKRFASSVLNKGHAKKHENSIPYGRSVDLKVLFDFSSLSSCNPLANIQSIVFNTIQLLWRLKIAVISCILAPIFLPYISIILSTKSIDYNSIEYIGMHSTCSVFDFLFQDSIFFLAVVNLALWLHNLLRNLVESVVLVIFFWRLPPSTSIATVAQ